MTDAGFDPSRAVRFELAQGVVLSRADARLVVLEASVLDALAARVDDATRAELGRLVGRALGHRVAQRLGGADGARAARAEIAAQHLAGELAVAGLGALALERWGRALVVVLERPAVTDDRLLSALLGGALEVMAGRPLVCEPLARDARAARWLVAREATARRVRGWIATGVAWADAVSRLHASAGGPE